MLKIHEKFSFLSLRRGAYNIQQRRGIGPPSVALPAFLILIFAPFLRERQLIMVNDRRVGRNRQRGASEERQIVRRATDSSVKYLVHA